MKQKQAKRGRPKAKSRTHGSLAAKYKQREGEFPDAFRDRMRRAISWVERAEEERGKTNPDPYAAVVFYWIAFNAAYGMHDPLPEHADARRKFRQFFRKVVKLDEGGEQPRIYNIIWDKYSGPIRSLLDNHFVFAPFWKHQHGDPEHADWERKFRSDKRRAFMYLKQNSTVAVLSVVFDRLYVLRNQLIHGEATWRDIKTDETRRPQVQDGERILSALVPVFIDIMMDHPHLRWGSSHYPVIRG
ncbi:MAG: HEPN domain-containing protein [Alphaproteobacteria bacterium]|nr:HEPN domain-containing protein [Alphaproteobacteria bacterium]MDA7987204.1 HEPN domain-containing protein [Alphaproteobacteria bacterium]MDA8001397.1 HEPN domain-containing protein [Alphaproteobacteria bacterium]MDA8003961.1 HEPN domain-containing protein [Alphaproteobacteria bacterium]MDA8006294.1 HEPN domain-containing protein [Alphaproteobacteria bacterium]